MTQTPRNIILSRKGFDSVSGGCASPILPDGSIFSLPIDYAPGATKRYCDLTTGRSDAPNLGVLASDLSGGHDVATAPAHVDPDIDHAALPRLPGWKGSFGQVETGQVHLANNQVGPGDVFLFHGWFREVEKDLGGRWRFRREAPDLNVIFGWLQVGEVVDLERELPDAVKARHPWLRDHPHLNLPTDLPLHPSAHAIFVAADRLRLPGFETPEVPGAGVFRKLESKLVLTAPHAAGRSTWLLPHWFKGGDGRPWLTNFPRPEWWEDVDEGTLLRPVGRQGQEAVLDCRSRPEAAAWLGALIATPPATPRPPLA